MKPTDLIFVLLPGVLATLPALGAPTTSTSATASVGRCGWTPTSQFVSDTRVTGAEAYLRRTDPTYPADIFGEASGRASAAYGTNGVYASSVSKGASYVSAVAESRWEDTWTISGGSGTGSGVVSAHVTGNASVVDDSDDYPSLALVQYEMHRGAGEGAGILSLNQSFAAPFSGPFDGTVSGGFSFEYGVPFSVSGLFNARANVPSQAAALLCNPMAPRLFYDGSAELDFELTAVLTDVALPPGASLVAASGTVYPTSVVPLPASVLLFGGTLVTLGGAVRRRGIGTARRPAIGVSA